MVVVLVVVGALLQDGDGAQVEVAREGEEEEDGHDSRLDPDPMALLSPIGAIPPQEEKEARSLVDTERAEREERGGGGGGGGGQGVATGPQRTHFPFYLHTG